MSASLTVSNTGTTTLSAGTILGSSGLATSTLVNNNPTTTPYNTGTPYFINSASCYINSTFSTINLMENNTSQPQQVKVAVFEIERNEDQEVVSTKFVKDFWLEHKPKANLTLVVAKELAKDVDLDKIVIRELSRISF